MRWKSTQDEEEASALPITPECAGSKQAAGALELQSLWSWVYCLHYNDDPEFASIAFKATMLVVVTYMNTSSYVDEC